MTVNIKNIRQAAARLDGVAVRTPLLQNDYLNQRLQAKVFIKPESLQHIGAFKFRGAYNRLSQLNEEQRALGVVAFSSGNHAQGIALAARLLGMQATIVMPSDAPALKLEGTQRLGATIRSYERASEVREEIAADIAADTGATLVPAFEDPDIIAGQGTCGLEIIEQMDALGETTQSVLIPCGGGGLLAGTSTAVKALSPATLVYGVEPQHYDDHLRSRQVGHRVAIDATAATLCDALMAPMPGELTWSINSKSVTDFLLVTEEDVAHAVSFAFRYLKLVVEPGGVVALAALLANKLDVSGSTVAILLSGGNIDSTVFTRCLQQYPSPE
ncbi:MAG: pyridoxal-5'-phosphate-dependent protein [Gammaproteobacteria bacterium]|jgi:threonine dehydratase|nr:pyridoxal-5'-phosphate-dependent protein [Gammaproteobacteria bacterium]HJN95198.1 threonine/serine dehydratase [Gammaproteobacteria bacterium]|tara:strand:+ start:31107 stop:32093 length:987 start_codon:yes stop_codon:yes gene_type:complete